MITSPTTASILIHVNSSIERWAIIGAASMLKMLKGRLGANDLRELILDGSSGILYRVDTSTNVADPSASMPWQQLTLINLFGFVPIDSNVPTISFRAKE